MPSGRQTLDSIEQALAGVRREESELDASIERATRTLTDLQARQAESYRNLARFRLDSEAANDLDSRLDQSARQAKALLEKRENDQKILFAQLRDKEAERKDLQEIRNRLTLQRDDAATRMDELMEAVDARLEQDPAFQEQKQKAEAATRTAEAAAAKATTTQEDREEKGKAYEADRLFVYLWDRGFGTPDYDHRGIIRALDRWVAGLIRYHDARANYAMLTSIPERMSAHAERCAEAADEEAEKLAALSRQAMTDTAGEDLAASIDGLTDQIDNLTPEAEELDRSIDTLSDALRAFSEGSDTGFMKAEEAFSTSLQGDALKDLWRHALSTPSPDDEKIVAEIEALMKKADDQSLEIKRARLLREDVTKRRSELTEVARNFRRSGYDDWDSTFTDDTLTTVLLGELLKGAITGAEYWKKARKSHKRRKPRGGQQGFKYGTGLPKSMGGGFSGRGLGGRSRNSGRRRSRGGFGGGFGGGGFKSGKGGFGGGGFKTGDTF